jgi:hypothetical protein
VTSLRKTGETLADICQKTGLKNSTVRYIQLKQKSSLLLNSKAKTTLRENSPTSRRKRFYGTGRAE